MIKTIEQYNVMEQEYRSQIEYHGIFDLIKNVTTDKDGMVVLDREIYDHIEKLQMEFVDYRLKLKCSIKEQNYEPIESIGSLLHFTEQSILSMLRLVVKMREKGQI